jgi:hypothetical protein
MRKNKKPKGAIDIYGSEVAAETHHTRQHLFTLKAHVCQETERVYYLQGCSEEDQAAWIEVLVQRAGVEKQK